MLLISILSVSFILILTIIILYNSLVKSRNLVQSAYADIDVNLMKRFQLVPNLVSITKQYATYESNLLLEIVEKRTAQPTIGETAAIDGEVSRVLKTLQVTVENYPDLKANHTFSKLMDDLGEIEDHLVYARRFYNGTTREYNTKTQSFPRNIIAKMFGFSSQPYYEVESSSQREIPLI